VGFVDINTDKIDKANIFKREALCISEAFVTACKTPSVRESGVEGNSKSVLTNGKGVSSVAPPVVFRF
jgi:hypothetical protein